MIKVALSYRADAFSGPDTVLDDRDSMAYGLSTVGGGVGGVAGGIAGGASSKLLQNVLGSEKIWKSIPKKYRGVAGLGAKALPLALTGAGAILGQRGGASLGKHTLNDAYQHELMTREFGRRILGKKRGGTSLVEPMVGSTATGAITGAAGYVGGNVLTKKLLGKSSILKKFMPKNPLSAMAIGGGIGLGMSLFDRVVKGTGRNVREYLTPIKTKETYTRMGKKMPGKNNV